MFVRGSSHGHLSVSQNSPTTIWLFVPSSTAWIGVPTLCLRRCLSSTHSTIPTTSSNTSTVSNSTSTPDTSIMNRAIGERSMVPPGTSSVKIVTWEQSKYIATESVYQHCTTMHNFITYPASHCKSTVFPRQPLESESVLCCLKATRHLMTGLYSHS